MVKMHKKQGVKFCCECSRNDTSGIGTNGGIYGIVLLAKAFAKK